MQWEHLVQSEFERMVKEEKLCIIPMAVLERHGDQWETSLMMSVAPESVRMDLHKIPEPICDIARTKKVLGRVETCFDWYASYPDYVTGSPSKASKEAGDKLMDFYIKRVAKDIKAIKEDEVTPALQKEFLEKGAKVGK